MIVLTAVAGGLGAAARFGLDTALIRWLAGAWQRLMVINISGSVLLGLVAGLAAQRIVSPELQMVVGAGLLGGYTTFSAASLATVQLTGDGRWGASLLSSVGMLVAATAGAAVGLVVGLRL